MEDKDIAIIGSRGHVGKGMLKIFPQALQYDPPAGIKTTKDEINERRFVVICVPTPTAKDGWSCDTRIVEEIFEWLRVPLVLIKSTVSVGTTNRIQEDYTGGVAFSPEYMGESKYYVPPRYPDPRDPRGHGFMIIGGKRETTKKIYDIFMPIMGPHTIFMQTDSRTAEFIKYQENIWGSLKVCWANEMYECAEALGIDYRDAREGWALDPRTERMHTACFVESRGYGGKCYPKDIRAFIATVKQHSYIPKLLMEVVKTNNRIRKKYGYKEV